LFYSCNSYREILYLHDANINTPTKIQNHQEITIHPYDRISIIISSKTPELSIPFNLTSVSYSLEGVSSSLNQEQKLYYTVNKNGYIELPILGEIHVKGLTQEQLTNRIKEQLTKENYINNPIITIQFINMNVYVAGEVANPGVYEINKNYLTLLEAITMAGDLTAYGNRNNVKVIRENNGERIIYSLNLLSTELFNSPAYYLHQNDYIYVEPVNVNRKKLIRDTRYIKCK
jgi:polysaccharide export outer membrane protein